MKGMLMVDVFYRDGQRAPLERMAGVFGPMSRAMMWSLVSEIRALAERYHLEGRDAANPSQEDIERHPTTQGR
jgi:hypothetical protein